MPIVKRRAVLPLLTGGLHYTNNTLTIEATQAQRIVNCHIDEHGIASTRHGSSKLNSSALPAPITSIYEFRRPYGSGNASTILVTAGLILYYWDTGSSTFIQIMALSVTDRPCWTTFQSATSQSYAIMCNGTDFIKYDGSTATNVASSYPWSSAPRYIIDYDDRLLAAGCDSDPYKIWVSAILDCTDWYPDTSVTPHASVNWTVKSATGNRVTGLKNVYDYCAIFQQHGVSIITEGDPNSNTSKQLQVSLQYGTSSHWSIQSISNKIYFADESHFYQGILRDAIENGLEVIPIDINIIEKYREFTNAGDIISVYDLTNKEIQFAGMTGINTYNNLALLFNLGLTNENNRSSVTASLPEQYIWSGWFEGDGYEVTAFASVINSDGMTVVYRGDSSGYVYEMDGANVYKDGTENIKTEIYLCPFAPYGYSMAKRARTFTPLIYQKYDKSTTVRWIVDGRYTDVAISYYNNVAYWRPTQNLNQLQTWDGTIWADKPIMIQPMAINEPFQYIQFVIINAGTNDEDEIAYMGSELFYQLHTLEGGRKVG